MNEILCLINITDLIYAFAELLKKYRNYLTDMEFEELKIYKQIWYFGQSASKVYTKSTSNLNSGYDDDNGNYKIVSLIIRKNKQLIFLYIFHLVGARSYCFSI